MLLDQGCKATADVSTTSSLTDALPDSPDFCRDNGRSAAAVGCCQRRRIVMGVPISPRSATRVLIATKEAIMRQLTTEELVQVYGGGGSGMGGGGGHGHDGSRSKSRSKSKSKSRSKSKSKSKSRH